MRVNTQITVNEVRLVDSDGKMLGVMGMDQALSIAKSRSLDLVEISPDAAPPVCKIMDFARFKYEEKKKSTEAKKKQKTLIVKEIKIKPNIGINDLNTKIKHMRDFIIGEDHVKVSLIYRGRQALHKENGMKLFDKICADTLDIAKPEYPPKLLGNILYMKLVPIAKSTQ